MHGKHKKARVRILVKAFPQPSTKHEETVCCAGVSEDGESLLRLYPIRYRRLPKEHRFDRYDLVEMTVTKASSDSRPESYRVDEGSIRLLEKGKLNDEAKVRLWRPFIAPSIGILLEDNKSKSRSLGIVKPQPDSIRFVVKLAKDSSADDKAVARLVAQQVSLLEEPLRPLATPKYAFHYQFHCADPSGCTCASNPHLHQIHDWEVQATYLSYMRRYGSEDEAMEKMVLAYQGTIPERNLHFIMGTMAAHPRTFIVIGLLRSGLDPADLARQGELEF